MKFVVMWHNRQRDVSAAERIEQSKDTLEALGRWKPPAGLTISEQLERLDGSGGFAVVEAEDAVDLADASMKFAPWLEWDLVPVMDLMDERTLTLMDEAQAFNA